MKIRARSLYCSFKDVELIVGESAHDERGKRIFLVEQIKLGEGVRISMDGLYIHEDDIDILEEVA